MARLVVLPAARADLIEIGDFIALDNPGRAASFITEIEAVMKAYQLYLEQMPPAPGEEAVLSLTRAWTLVRFFDSKMLTTARCGQCGGEFVTHSFDLNHGYACGLCHMPSRAGKTKKAREDALSA